MTKKELLQKLAEITGMTQKDCEKVYNAFLKTIEDGINKDTEQKLAIPGLGTMKITVREAFESKNPKTGEVVAVPTKRVIRMSVSDSIKNKLTQPEA